MKKTILSLLLIGITSTIFIKAERKNILLNENWMFRLNYQATSGTERRVDLPHTWNAQDALSGKPDYYRGLGNYEKTLFIPSQWKGKRIFVKFEGANSITHFFVNAKHVGEHKGGYTAFTFEITQFVEYGKENKLLARVNNAPTLDVMPLVGDFNYYGGIYRDVHLLITEPICISPLDHSSSGVYLIQEKVTKEQAQIQAKIMLSNTLRQPEKAILKIKITDKNNKTITTKTQNIEIPAGENTYPVYTQLQIEKPHLWNGRIDPYLYKVEVTLEKDNETIDKIIQPLGLRYYSVDPEKGFFLNGEPYRLKGVCRHQDRSEIGNALKPQHHEEDVAIIQEIGANAVRLSHYPQATYLLDLLDKHGIIAWSEIPFVGPGGYLDRGFVDSETFKKNGKQQLIEMIKQHFNHPSICFWGLYNELKMEGDNPVEYLKELNKIAHEIDPTRLTTAASFQDGEINQITDLIAWNKYFGWYGGPPSGMAEWADKTHQTFPNLKIAVSEYGAGASIYHQQDTLKPAVPVSWWHPENWQTYYHIENWKILKERPYLWGTFIWAMFDFGSSIRTEGDTYGRNDKGLVTMDRKTKKDAFYFYKANWNEEPMIYIAEKRNQKREKPETTVTIFSNIREVELIINGKSMGTKTPNEVSVLTWEKVPLISGKNQIEAVAKTKKEKYKDTCIWYLDN